jgi:hypothetical protein
LSFVRSRRPGKRKPHAARGLFEDGSEAVVDRLDALLGGAVLIRDSE